ncbi:MAG TPA: ferric reductase-like transmembrane domain-containing protein [Candidatus Sulfotelmatobacter sp.]|nr:ferric reductase-like transmembrane domain-containing protein [Candidatus Sulfotelmatobacter sp.]
MKDIRFAKTVLLVNGLVPGTLLLWDVYHGQAGANPVNYAILTLGLCALIFLSLALLVTPLRKVTGLQWLFHLRRRLGLLAFGYALAHFSTFFIFDRMLSVRSTLSEMVKRPYLIVGSIGLLALVPLAATSTNAMIKRLGPKRWQALHRLAYGVAVAGVVHFYMQVKSDTRLPLAFGGVVAILLGYRVALALGRRWERQGRQPAAAPVEASPDAGRWSGQLRVERIVQETPDVRTFRLRPAAGEAFPFDYLPGQYLTISLPIGGKTVRRSYTIASTPTRSGYCEITTKREAQGLVSRHMHDTLTEGDRVAIAGPAGRFTFTGAEADSVALLAGGVGITPLMSILRSLTDRRWGGKIYFVYSAKAERDIIFREELQTLQRQFPNLHLTLTLTRPDSTSWDGATGRIDATLLTHVIPDVTGIPFYLCGPAEMLVATRALLRKLGVQESNIRTESFGARWSSATSGAVTDGAAFTVTFSRSNKTAPIDDRRPILALADELGIQVDSECRSGICGRCKTRLVSGAVAMETQDALDTADRRSNIILLCQARALGDVTVEA